MCLSSLMAISPHFLIVSVLNTIREPEKDLDHFYANTYLIIRDCGHMAVASLRQ